MKLITQHEAQFNQYEFIVKTEPTDMSPKLIGYYVHIGLQRAKLCVGAKQTKGAHLRLMNTLEEAMCDHLLTTNWRLTCYRHLKRLLPLAYELFGRDEYQQYVDRINSLNRYFGIAPSAS